MHKFTQIAGALLIGASISLAAAAADKVFVKVNGVSVSQNLADAFISEQKARGAPDSPKLREDVRDMLIRRELLAQQARKAGLHKKPDIAARAEAAKQDVFINSYVQQYVERNPINDDQLQAKYQEIKAQDGSTEYKTRHILVKDESEARAIIGELQKDAGKFAELAKQSIDPGSKDKGGDLGWAMPSRYVKSFADALAALERGKFTETPVQSQFGYHVILLEDTRPATFPSFEEVKQHLQRQMQQQQVIRMVNDLRAKAKIE